MVEIRHLGRSNHLGIPEEGETKKGAKRTETEQTIQNDRVEVGKFTIMVEKRDDQYVAICRNCGCILSSLEVNAIETGFYYCSSECAKEDIEKERRIVEYEESE